MAEYNGIVEAVSRGLVGYDRALTRAEDEAERDRVTKRTT